MKRTLAIAATAIITVAAAATLGLWLFLDVNQFRPLLERSLSEALGRKVTVGTIKVALLSGGVSLEGLTIADDPAFSREPFVTASAVSAGVELKPLIFSRSLRVQSFRVEQPRVALRRSTAGVWNISTLGASSSTTRDTAGTAMSLFIRELVVADGQIVVAGAGRVRTATYSDVDVTLSDLSLTAPFAFRADAALPNGGTARLDGTAGPFNAAEIAATPFDGKIDVGGLDIAVTGFMDAGSGLKGFVDLAGTLTSDGIRFTSKGKVAATRVQLVPDGSPTQVPVVVEYDAAYNSGTRRGVFRRGDVRIGGAAARLTGDYSTKGATPSVRLRLVGEKMPIAHLEGALPALGTTLPAGASFRQGTMDATLAIEGRVDRLVVSGPMVISNGTLAGFDLGGRLRAIASLAGVPKGSDTVLETLSAHLRISLDGIAIDGLSMVVPTIGTMTGAGTVAPDDALNFRMLAKRTTGLGIPFRITGTSANPSFGPDLGAIGKSVKTGVTDAAKNPDLQKKAVQAIGDFFRRRKEGQD